jgi:NAD(P)-dependent dehydrogenase (short-subunit alcohol dehydrogenase family)
VASSSRAYRPRRIGEPEDVGVAIAALLGDESRWITAQNLEMSGGYGL